MKEIINIEIHEKKESSYNYQDLFKNLFSKKYFFIFLSVFTITLCSLVILRKKSPSLGKKWQAKILIQSNYNDTAKQIVNLQTLSNENITVYKHLFYFFIKELKSLNYLAKSNDSSPGYKLMNIKSLDPKADLFELSLRSNTKKEAIASLRKNLEVATKNLSDLSSKNNYLFKTLTKIQANELKQSRYRLTTLHLIILSFLLAFISILGLALSKLTPKRP